MWKVTLILFTFLLASHGSKAQIQKEDFDIVHSIFTKTKKNLVSNYMAIEPSQTAFWRLYDQYEARRKAIVTERYSLLKEYADNYVNLDDATASRLAHRFMKNTARTEALNTRYFKKFEKLVGGLQATTLFQIELYIETAMQANTLTQIPIIGELQKMEEFNQQAR
jgi:hypothetical protein